ncbi:MAG: BatD family protein [Candidatus Altiarchaeia archaeon]
MKKLLLCAALALFLTGVVFAANTNCTNCGTKENSTVSVSAAPPVASASKGSFTIEKTALSKIILGETLTLEITIKNNYPTNLTVELREDIAGAEVVDFGGFVLSGLKGSSIPLYYKKTVEVSPNSQTTITYSIKPLYHGTLIIPETEATTANGHYVSNSLVLEVECNKNKLCETDQAENAITCPQDCSPDKKDELCNPRKDSVCDPDCKNGEDPDCGAVATNPAQGTTTTLASLCGNQACDKEQENYLTCPLDCPSGAKDGYCDKVKDARCDPDCAAGEDPDCGGSSSWGIVITVVFVIVLLLIIAYKKGWLKKVD